MFTTRGYCLECGYWGYLYEEFCSDQCYLDYYDYSMFYNWGYYDEDDDWWY